MIYDSESIFKFGKYKNEFFVVVARLYPEYIKFCLDNGIFGYKDMSVKLKNIFKRHYLYHLQNEYKDIIFEIDKNKLDDIFGEKNVRNI
jgi:hypothetical protein